MITHFDENLCHQLATTFDHVYTSDPRWTERVVLYAWDTANNVNIMTGMARYANRNVIDAYGMVTIGGEKAHVVRASRELRPEVDATRVGPFTYSVVEPLAKVRSALSDNPHGLTFDLIFNADYDPYEQIPMFSRRNGRILEEARRYYQLGRPEGWIEVAGRRIAVDPKSWYIGRDHSWGVRRGGGGGAWPEPMAQQEAPPPGVLYFMCIFDFGSWMVHCAVREDHQGRPNHFEGWVSYPRGSAKHGQQIQLTGVDHDLTFRKDARLATKGRVTLSAIDGTKIEIDFTATSLFLPGLAGYDNYRGYCSGMWKGPSWMDGFVTDINDPAEYGQVRMLSETICSARCGSDTGHGLLEMVNLGKVEKYGYTSY